MFAPAVAANYEFVRDTIVTWDPLPSPPPEYYGIELERLTDIQVSKTLLSHTLCMQVVIKKLKFKILVVCEKLPSGDVFFFF